MKNIKLKPALYSSVRKYLGYIDTNFCDLKQGDKVTIDIEFTDEFIPLEQYVITVGVLKDLYHKEVEMDINYNINTYAQRIDFYNVLGLKATESFIRHSSIGKFCEIREVDEFNSSEIVSAMIKIVESKCSLSNELIGCLNYCWYEVVGNIIEHSESPINGYVVAQYYPSKKLIRIVMLDHGIGIQAALGKNTIYANISEQDALMECIKEGVTNGNGMGRGLFHTSEFIKANGGLMKIYSGEHMLKVTAQETKVDDSARFNGTLVVLDINTDTDVELQSIFKDDIPTTVLEWNECVNDLW